MTTFHVNLFTDLREMLAYPFMLHAFEAGTVIAVVAGLVSYLVILRRSAFASHAMAHVGFAGAAGAVLVGVNPVFGLLSFTSIAGTGIAVLGPRAANRDVEIGTVLAFMLGLGVLFISLYSGYSNETYSILFGEILGISESAVVLTLEAGVVILAVFAVFYRPLMFSALDEDVAEAKGMPVRLLGVVFMLLLAAAVSIAVQVIGVLLIFALLVTPAAIALRLSKRPRVAVALSVLIALFATWTGLFLSWYEPYPVSFTIVTLVFGAYLALRTVSALREGRLWPAALGLYGRGKRDRPSGVADP
jgi:zinc/manganese transport system permease protein